jgi:RsmE family RNA methyltransferase
MHRFFIPLELLAAETVTLPAGVARQVARVLRLRAGERVALFGGDGAEAEAVLERVDPAGVTARVVDRRFPAVELPCRLHVALAALKGEKLDWAVQKLTELGAARITLLLTERTVAAGAEERWPRRLERYARIAQEAAEQSGRVRVPVVDGPQTLAEALQGTVVTAELLAQAREVHGRTGKPLEEILETELDVDAFKILQGKAYMHNMWAVDLNQRPPEPSAIHLVPADVARRHKVVPIAKINRAGQDMLVVGVADPSSVIAMEEISAVCKLKVLPVLAPARQVEDQIAAHYPEVAPVGNVSHLTAARTMRLILDPHSSLGLTSMLRSRPERVLLLVGPEGGFTEAEVETARAAGTLPVRMGARILRAETAALCGAALVASLAEEGPLR